MYEEVTYNKEYSNYYIAKYGLKNKEQLLNNKKTFLI